MHGELSDGTRWWREAGTSELENGRICEWTLVRGQSADGSVEWEEKWWSSADAFDYKELGAIKSGRDGHGNVWQESWSEISCSDVSRGFFTDASKKIERSANKWGADANGAEWHEDWREAYWGDGVVDRECFKKSCIGKAKSRKTATRLDGTITGRKMGWQRRVHENERLVGRSRHRRRRRQQSFLG